MSGTVSPPEKKHVNTGALRGTLLLTLCAMIWGGAFVAQNVSMDFIGPFTFTAIRSFIGAAALLPFVIAADRKELAAYNGNPDLIKKHRIRELKILLIMGPVMFVPTNMQQIGLITTSPGKSGFITAMYIVAVPILSLFIGKRMRFGILISVALAVAGLYLLCVTERLTIGSGDTITLISVFFWAIEILCIDRFSKEMNSIKITFGAFFICGVLSAISMLLFEQPSWNGIAGCILPLMYTGVMSTGVAYSLQAAGQKTTPPTVASLVMSLESVFAAVFGFIILGDKLTGRELAGCGLILIAVVLTQLFPSEERVSPQTE